MGNPSWSWIYIEKAGACLVNRIGKVLRTGEEYELRDTDGTAISVAEGRRIVTERLSIPAEVRNARLHRPDDAA